MKALLVLALLIGTASLARTQTTDDIRGYEISCFCNLPGREPKEIILLDNNGQILLAAREGTTLEQLKTEHVRYTESQLQLLVDWGLLREENGRYTTMLPMLNRSETERLRAEIHGEVLDSLPEFRDEMAGFVQQLRAVHREKSAFTILFSYVLDDLVWEDFYHDGMLTPRDVPSGKHPFWTGVLWAGEPARKFAPGTNGFGGEGLTIDVNWSTAALPELGPLISQSSMDALRQELQKHGRITDPSVLKTFAPYGMADAQGNLTVPVITERTGEPLYDRANKLAAEVEKAVRTHVPFATIESKYRLHGSQEALVIAYHEFMWELLDELAAEHLVEKPVALVAPAAARPSDIGDLVFVIRHN